MRKILVLGFPGVGKTYLKEKFKGTEISILDSDSSGFSKSLAFPQNYIKHIECNLPFTNGIMISTHDKVRNAIKNSSLMHKKDLDIYICYPSLEIKEQWLQRLKDRGNNEQFIKLIDDNYTQWINEIKAETEFKHLEITEPTSNLYDKLDELKIFNN